MIISKSQSSNGYGGGLIYTLNHTCSTTGCDYSFREKTAYQCANEKLAILSKLTYIRGLFVETAC